MPFQGNMPIKLVGAKAGAGLTASTAQYRFVKMSADQTVVLCTAATDRPCGVLQAPVGATGDPVDVVSQGETQVVSNGTQKYGYGIGTDASGYAFHVEASITGGAQNIYYVAGMVVNIQQGTSAGNLITAVINCVNPPLGTLGG